MNLRNRYLIITIRTLLGLVFVFSGVSGFLMGNDVTNIPEPMATITTSLWDSGIFQMIKATEIIAGLMLLFGFLPALAVIFLAPVAVGILIVNVLLAPSFAIVGLILSLLLAYLGYAYWDKYRALFQR